MHTSSNTQASLSANNKQLRETRNVTQHRNSDERKAIERLQKRMNNVMYGSRMVSQSPKERWADLEPLLRGDGAIAFIDAERLRLQGLQASTVRQVGPMAKRLREWRRLMLGMLNREDGSLTPHRRLEEYRTLHMRELGLKQAVAPAIKRPDGPSTAWLKTHREATAIVFREIKW